MVGYVQVTNLNKPEILVWYFYQRPYIEVRSLIQMPADFDKSTRPLVISINECELTRTSEILRLLVLSGE